MNHFAYLHADKSGVVFYIGKGSGLRHLDFSNRGVSHKERVRQIGKDGVLVSKIECSSEEVALSLEKGLIKCAKRSGFELVNKSSGGSKGPVGYKMPEDTKKKLSILKTGFRHSAETKQLMSFRRAGKKRQRPLTEEQRAAISARLKGVAPSAACERAKILASSKAVICIDTGETFASASDAAVYIGLNKAAVANGIGKNCKVGGLSWRYI